MSYYTNNNRNSRNTFSATSTPVLTSGDKAIIDMANLYTNGYRNRMRSKRYVFMKKKVSTAIPTLTLNIGTMPNKAACASGYRDDGTSCWEDWKCNTTGCGCIKQKVNKYCKTKDKFGTCWSWGYTCPSGLRGDGTSCWEDAKTTCSGCGCIKTALWERQSCPTGKSLVAGLCYSCDPLSTLLSNGSCQSIALYDVWLYCAFDIIWGDFNFNNFSTSITTDQFGVKKMNVSGFVTTSSSVVNSYISSNKVPTGATFNTSNPTPQFTETVPGETFPISFSFPLPIYEGFNTTPAEFFKCLSGGGLSAGIVFAAIKKMSGVQVPNNIGARIWKALADQLNKILSTTLDNIVSGIRTLFGDAAANAASNAINSGLRWVGSDIQLSYTQLAQETGVVTENELMTIARTTIIARAEELRLQLAQQLASDIEIENAIQLYIETQLEALTIGGVDGLAAGETGIVVVAEVEVAAGGGGAIVAVLPELIILIIVVLLIFIVLSAVCVWLNSYVPPTTQPPTTPVSTTIKPINLHDYVQQVEMYKPIQYNSWKK